MKAILVFFDSLNRHMLPPYGNDWVHAPNFQRLAEQAVTFDNYYVGSMPCIPARRELHTGRYNFLHRSWGPIEPFDDSMPEILKQNGIYTHLATDHHHYFEDGGLTYHNRYSSWFFARGQEGDFWKAEVADPDIPENVRKIKKANWRQDWINRKYIQAEEEFPQARTFANGLEFIRTNYEEDDWLLQIETFDPHEPFYTPQKFKDLYPHNYDGPHLDWPDYFLVTETPEQVQHAIYEYAALVSMCDHHLGQVMDLMDQLEMWEDTMLIVITDHGYLLSEHGFWAKNRQPLYNEIAHVPLFIWDPRAGVQGERRQSLVQMIDMPATLYDYFEVPIPEDVEGQSLAQTLVADTPVREAALFGYHGTHVNVTDGRYVYMRGPEPADNRPLDEYTLMPTHIKSLFTPAELRELELAEPFAFTKGLQTLKVEGLGSIGTLNPYLWGTLLFDLEQDPEQENPLKDDEIERRMLRLMIERMQANDAPASQYERLGLPADGAIADEHLALERAVDPEDRVGTTRVTWEGKGKKMYYTLLHLVPFPIKQQFIAGVEDEIQQADSFHLDEDAVLQLIERAAKREGIALELLLGEIVKVKG